jgi:hypothetical protein
MSDEREYVEDAPEMRSVALHSRAPMAMPMMPRGIGLAKASPVDPSTFATTGTGFGRKAAPPPNAWKVPDELKPIPAMYPLERGNIYVADVTPQEIADRVVKTLKMESIHATFDDDEASATAETCDCVKFTVRLWADKGQVVVEVQRFAGCAFAFKQASLAILRSAKRSGAIKKGPPRSFKLPSCIPPETEEDRKRCIEEGLQIAIDLLKQDRLDAQRLAVESMAKMTSASNQNRTFAAELILKNDVLEDLISLVDSRRLAVHGERSSDIAGTQCALMHRQALTVLANCMDALEGQNRLQSVLADKKGHLLRSESLVAALLNDVSAASEHPHDACQAVRCLTVMVRASQDVRQKCVGLGVANAISLAQTHAICRHALLETETGKLHKVFADL